MGETAMMKRGPRASDAWHASPLRPLAQGWLTRLLSHAVADSTAKQWIPKVRGFLAWALKRGLPLVSRHDVVGAMAQYFDWLCYAERMQPAVGPMILFGLLHVVPELPGHMGLSSRFLKSWKKLSNSEEGGPICEEAAMLIAMTMMIAGYVTEAVWVLTQYDAYALGQDMEQLRPSDVVEAQGTFALLFGVATRSESAKTRQTDHCRNWPLPRRILVPKHDLGARRQQNTR